jgi:hypothetical protein
MTATVSTLMRHRDVSGVSGEGAVATVCEFESGLTAVHWDSETPSVAIYTDVRHVLDLHGHKGATTLVLNDTERLLAGYQLVTPWLLSARYHDRPITCKAHPDHPDRLRATFKDERVWRFWISLLDGSSHAAVHEEVNGEIEHRWVHPSGNVWLVYFTPLLPRLIASEAFVVPADETPLQNFEREDR